MLRIVLVVGEIIHNRMTRRSFYIMTDEKLSVPILYERCHPELFAGSLFGQENDQQLTGCTAACHSKRKSAECLNTK